MQPGLVSVILPNRDHAHYLGRALEAFRAQTYGSFEVVVVDDASSDESCALVEEVAATDARIKLLRLDRSVGVNAAVNAGLSRATGEFLYCAAADDWVSPIFFERSLDLLQSHPACAFCFADPMEDRGERRLFPLYLSSSPRAFTAQEMFDELQRNYFHISSNTVLYRRTAFDAAGGYRADLEWFADWFLNHVLALRHGACYLPEALTCLTVREDSYSAVNLRRRLKQHELMIRTLDLLASPAFGDVRSSFRDAALLPEYKFRDIAWLLTSSPHRRYLTASLVRRIVGRSLWSGLRPIVPTDLRRRLRRLSSGRQQDEASRL